MSSRALAVAVLSLSLAACFEAREPTPDAGEAPDSVELTGWMAAVSREVCRRQVECSPLLSEDWSYGTDSCHPGLPFFSASPEVIEAHTAGELRFDAVRAAECLARLRGGHGCSLASEEIWSLCHSVVEGTAPLGALCAPRRDRCGAGLRCDATSCRCEAQLADGERCAAYTDCHEPLTCGPYDGSAPPHCWLWRCSDDSMCAHPRICVDGECVEESPAMEGESCARRRACAAGLWCSSDDICRPMARLGEPCAGFRCADGLACRTVCVELRAGDACGFDRECAPDAPYCVDVRDFSGGTCSASPVGRQCMAGIVFEFEVYWFGSEPPAEGDACAPDGACVPLTDGPFAGGLVGSCQPVVPTFGACASSMVCPESHRCEAGRCVPVILPDAGAACGPDALCPSSHACDDGRCVPRPLLGDACDEHLRCLRGACVGGTCRMLAAGEGCRGTPYECLDGNCGADGRCPDPSAEPVPCSSHGSCRGERVCAPSEESSICVEPTCGA